MKKFEFWKVKEEEEEEEKEAGRKYLTIYKTTGTTNKKEVKEKCIRSEAKTNDEKHEKKTLIWFIIKNQIPILSSGLRQQARFCLSFLCFAFFSPSLQGEHTGVRHRVAPPCGTKPQGGK